MSRIHLTVLLLALLLPAAALAEPDPDTGTETTADAPAGTEPAAAEPAPEVPPLVVEAGELLDAIRELDGEFAELERSRKEASTELDRQAVDRRLLTKALERVELADALADNVLAQEAEGLDASVYRKEAESRLERRGPAARRAILSLEKQLADDSARRDSVPVEERDAFDDVMASHTRIVDQFYRLLFENGERMAALGLDAGDDRAWLAERLPNRAETLAGRLELAGDEQRRARARAEAKPDDLELQERLARAEKRVELVAESLTSTIGTMKKLGLDTADYQQLLIERTGRIGGGLLDLEVAGRLLRGAMEALTDWVAANAGEWLARLLAFAAILFVFRLFARFTGKIVERSINSSKLNLSQLLKKMFVNIASKGVMVIGILVALSQLGIQIGPMLAGLGIAGFILGFALQDTLSNFAAGMMILIYRPFDVDDVIEAGAVMGKVSAMSLVSTTVLTFDNQTLVVPNNKIWGDVIRNVTAQRVRRVDLVFGIGYESDIPHAEQVLQSIVKEHPKVLESPEPVIKLHNLGDSSVDFIVRPWARTEDYWQVYWDLTREVKMRFDREGISIPFPQRDVHLISANGSGAKPGAS
jgi:small conductance mechanosensitive channel